MTPWDLAKPGTEHAHQRAVFAWANCAALYGFGPAMRPETYGYKTRPDALAAYAYADSVTGANLAAPVPALALLFAIHNQGHGDAIRGARAKAEGVKAGIPDMMFPVPRMTQSTWIQYHGLFIELKRPKSEGKAKGVESGIQSEFAVKLSEQGYKCVVAFGWQEVTAAIMEYMR